MPLPRAGQLQPAAAPPKLPGALGKCRMAARGGWNVGHHPSPGTGLGLCGVVRVGAGELLSWAPCTPPTSLCTVLHLGYLECSVLGTGEGKDGQDPALPSPMTCTKG